MITETINIPRIYTAIAEWMACLAIGITLPKKVSNIKFAMISIFILVLQCVLLEVTENISIYLWIPIMVLAVLLMYIFFYLLCDIPRKNNLYYTGKAFLTAEFIASLEWQIAYFFDNNVSRNLIWHIAILVIIYSAMIFLLVYLEKKMRTSYFVYEISIKELISISLIVIAIFAFSNLSFIIPNTPFSGSEVMNIFNVRTLVDFGGVAILYAYQSRVFELQVEKELVSINKVLQSQYDNYRNYSESIDLINLKYHDLKHQIAGLRAEMSQEKREKWIDSMEKELQGFQPEIQTGNYILDRLILSKLNICNNQKIKFTCVVDGKQLSFMNVADICNIFGNALDNAIENVSLIEEEKRIIHMQVFAQSALLYISISNYCEHEIKVKNGFPISRKVDKVNHGFGMKSINYIVNKYNGNMSFGVEKDMFEIKMLIPIQQTSEK